ncbi:MAG TPA: PqqD family protein [Ilumatobacteraceae bacterium]|nr:PqqD family protein [Ilumatobacteraceae bacterium]
MAELRRRPEVLWRHCLDGAVLLAPGSDDVLHLSVVATALWDALDQPLDEAVLVAAFDDPQRTAEIESQIARLCNELVDAGVLLRQ